MALQKPLALTFSVLAGSLLLSSCTFNNPFENTASQESESAVTSDAGATTLSKALESGKPVRCQVTDKETGNITHYIAKNGNMRISSTDDSGMRTHVLMVGTTQYIWTEGSPEGMMYSINPEDMTELAEQYINVDAPEVPDNQEETQSAPEVDFNCQETDISDNEFELPANVTFNDVFAGMNNPATGNDDGDGMPSAEELKAFEEMINSSGTPRE
jgi:hypothetical protein